MAENSFTVTIDATAIQNAAKALAEVPTLLRHVILMRTINRLGSMAKTTITKGIAGSAGILQREARLGIQYSEATPSNLEYVISVQAEWVRGLVYIITRQDDKVCPLCIAAEQGGPYTQEQIAEFKRGHEHSGIVHHNCRCYLIPAARGLAKSLSEKGDIMGEAMKTVQVNAVPVLTTELSYGLSKLANDKGL